MSLNSVEDYWNVDAPNWITGSHPLLADSGIRAKAIIDVLQDFRYLRAARDLLDIGSGSGGVCAYLEDIDPYFVIAMDAAPEMLKRNPSRRKVLTDANQELPFADGCVDGVTQFFLNRYLHNPCQNTREIGRVTKSGGVILVMDHTYLGHSLEVKEFDPQQVKQSLEAICRSVHVMQVCPVFSDPESFYHRGPIYLVVGIK
ncbi:class I SAM-dependent methyltransferase [Candidatus Woesearchaeota archaeon]|nr:class I SAM-dependent methyltransferase [Candidatus Woesearchaeota archaeon]